MRVFSGEYFVVHWENANKQPAFTAKENYRTVERTLGFTDAKTHRTRRFFSYAKHG